jgi:hypothetical protein
VAPQSGNRIELELPTQPLLLFMARMIAGAVATHARFPHDQVDDFRLAVDELILTLTRGRDMEKTLHLDLEWDDGLVEAVATLHERGAIHSLRVGDRSRAAKTQQESSRNRSSPRSSTSTNPLRSIKLRSPGSGYDDKTLAPAEPGSSRDGPSVSGDRRFDRGCPRLRRGGSSHRPCGIRRRSSGGPLHRASPG